MKCSHLIALLVFMLFVLVSSKRRTKAIINVFKENKSMNKQKFTDEYRFVFGKDDNNIDIYAPVFKDNIAKAKSLVNLGKGAQGSVIKIKRTNDRKDFPLPAEKFFALKITPDTDLDKGKIENMLAIHSIIKKAKLSRTVQIIDFRKYTFTKRNKETVTYFLAIYELIEMNLVEYISRRPTGLNRQEIQFLAFEMMKSMDEFHKSSRLCHNDAQLQNFGIKGESVKLFDFDISFVKNIEEAREMNDNSLIEFIRENCTDRKYLFGNLFFLTYGYKGDYQWEFNEEFETKIRINLSRVENITGRDIEAYLTVLQLILDENSDLSRLADYLACEFNREEQLKCKTLI